MDQALSGAILAWYAERGRPLAFRRTRDPYAILVSEVMAQQTQAARAAEAWERFLATFPTFAALAAASPADVLRAWRGLGYDRRGLNLWRTAGIVTREFGGELPRSIEALEALPGIGPYTARAVAALAFGVPVGAVDTNVRRVLGRIVLGEAPRAGSREIQMIADRAVPPDDPAGWTHALMDIGATLCRGPRPDCAACPAQPWCRFAADRPSAVASPATTRRTTPGASPRRPARRFPDTTRWLRGRIMDRLRDAAPATWVELAPTIGTHGRDAVSGAVAALARDGLVDVDGDADLRARLRIV